jgi:hypothetical protein
VDIALLALLFFKVIIFSSLLIRKKQKIAKNQNDGFPLRALNAFIRENRLLHSGGLLL